jgi:hypothetical protein
MSKLTNSLEQSIYELDVSQGRKKPDAGLRKFCRGAKYYILELYYDYIKQPYFTVKHFFRNVRFFWPHILHMKDFDSHYQIQLFCDSLEYLARGLKRWNHCVGSDRNYKRCMTASKQLRKAYADESYKDKSYRALSNANPVRFVKLGNGFSQMTHDYKKTEEYYTKMFKVINKRTSEAEKRAKKEAWDYIHKYIQSFWD